MTADANDSTNTSAALPADIEATLRRLIRRARVVLVVRGLCAVAAVALLTLLAVMGADAACVIFQAYPRWLMSLGALAATLLTAVVGLIRPLARSFTLAGAARAIEQRHPELHERISSAVELAGSADAPEIRGSDALIAELVRSAADDAVALRPTREVTFGRAKPYAVAAGVGAAVLGIVLAIWPEAAGRLLYRAVAPYRNLGNAPSVALSVAPGAKVLLQGQRLTVTVDVAGRGVASADLRLRRRGDDDEVLSMSRIADDQFARTLPPATGDFAYRVHAEGALSQYYAVTVVAAPEVASIDVAYEYPSYTNAGSSARPAENADGSLRALRHSVAVVTVHTNRPMAKAVVTVNKAPVEGVELDGAVCRFRVPLDVDGAWRIALTDEYGFRNKPRDYPITVVPDAPPKVAIHRPGAALQVKPDDRVAVTFVLADDFGLTDAELLLEADGRALPPTPLPTDADGSVVIDLAGMPTAGVAELAYRIRARDNLPAALGGPQIGQSARHTLDLRADAVDYATQVRLAMELQIREALEKALAELRAAKAISEPIRRTMPNLKVLDTPTVEKVNVCRSHLIAADTVIRRLVDATAVSEYAPLAQVLTGLLDGDIARASHLLNMIKLTDAVATRSDQADEADFAIDAAIAELAGLLSKLSAMTELMYRADVLEQFADRQAELAGETAAGDNPPADGASKGQTDPMADSAQDRLTDDIGRFVRQTPGAQQQQLRADARAAEDLVALARRLQHLQQELAGQSQRVAQIDQLDDERAELSARQYEIARQAGALAKQLAALGGPAKAAMAVADLAKQAGHRLAGRPGAKPRPRRGEHAKSTLPAGEPGRYGQADAAALQPLEAAIQDLQPKIDRQLRLAELAGRAKALRDAHQILRARVATLAARRAEQTATAAAHAAADAKAVAAAEAARKAADEAVGKLLDRARQLAKTGGAWRQDAGKNPAVAEAARSASPDGELAAVVSALDGRRIDQAAKGLAKAVAAAKDLTAATVQAAADAEGAAATARKAAEAEADPAKRKPLTEKADRLAAEAEAKAQQAAGAGQLADRAGKLSGKIDQFAKRLTDALATLTGAAGDLARARLTAETHKRDDPDRAGAIAKQITAARDECHDAARAVADLLGRIKSQEKDLAEKLTATDPVKALRQAAEALQRQDPTAAAASQGRAADQLKGLVELLRGAGGQVTDAKALGKTRDPINKLLDAQRALSRRVGELARRRGDAFGQVRRTEVEFLRNRQKQLSGLAREIAAALKKYAPQKDRPGTAAARAAAAAEQAIGQNKLDAATPQAAAAAAQLKALALHLGVPPIELKAAATTRPAMPPLAEADRLNEIDALPGTIADAARQQAQAAAVLAHLAGGQLSPALAARQQDVRTSTESLLAKVRLLTYHAYDLLNDDDALKLLDRADDALVEATAWQRGAISRLSAYRAAKAAGYQQRAAELLGKAAESLDQIGRKFAEAARRAPSIPNGQAVDREVPGRLAAAYDAAATAATADQDAAARRAARLLAALAARARGQLAAMGLPAPASGAGAVRGGIRAVGQGGQPGKSGRAVPDLSAVNLAELGIRPSDWAKLPGSLRSRVLQAAGDNRAGEYRPLIKQYFQEVARQAAAGSRTVEDTP